MKLTRFVTGPLGVNTYFIPVDEMSVFVVDPGGNPEVLLDYLSQTGYVLRAAILTHGHFDHLLALPELGKALPDLQVYIHKADRIYLGPCVIHAHSIGLNLLGLNDFIPTVSGLPEPDRLLVEGDIVEDSWTVMHTPGHTPGSLCLHNKKENILVSGDTLFDGSWGRTDLRGGSARQMQESLKRLFLLPPDTVVYPGHGPVTTIGKTAPILGF
jgi:glyoxylase-like metal-dependent hydrolase (beta-lactamase superfamily II)